MRPSGPSGTRSESMGAVLCWTSWLKEEATLRLVGKSMAVLCGNCSFPGGIWADVAAPLLILSPDGVPPSLSHPSLVIHPGVIFQ